jgi:hypothetical protein
MLLAEGAGSGSPMVVRQPYQKTPFAGPVQAAHGDPVFPHKKKTPNPKAFAGPHDEDVPSPWNTIALFPRLVSFSFIASK